MSRGSRQGASLAELLVALVLLAIGGSLATRTLLHATFHLERAELGLRAALLLAELNAGADVEERTAGPGLLLPDEAGEAALAVRFDPDGGNGEEGDGSGQEGRAGFGAPGRWVLGEEAP